MKYSWPYTDFHKASFQSWWKIKISFDPPDNLVKLADTTPLKSEESDSGSCNDWIKPVNNGMRKSFKL